MPGEPWRETIRGLKEASYGAGGTPTRFFYLRDVSFTKTRESRPHRFATGTRDNVRAHTQGPVVAGGSVTIPVSGDEHDEWLGMTVQGGVVATTPMTATDTRQRVYVPSETLDSGSFQRNDGADLQELTGVYGNSLRWSGSTDGESLITYELFAKNRDDTLAALTGTPTQRVPTFMEGWQHSVYIDNFLIAPATTIKDDLAFSWEITYGGNLDRVYLAKNALELSRISLGELDITATLTIDAAHASAAAEIANWLADTRRVLTIRAQGPANDIETGFNRWFQAAIPGAWMTPDTNQIVQGVRAYSLQLQYVYDPTNLFGVQFTTRNGRATTWAA